MCSVSRPRTVDPNTEGVIALHEELLLDCTTLWDPPGWKHTVSPTDIWARTCTVHGGTEVGVV